MTEGWVKIHRRLIENPIAKKPNYMAIWLTLLLKASHKPVEFIWNNRKQTLHPGQILTGRKALSKQTGVHESSVERILNYFEIEHQIEQQKTKKHRIITIKNWVKYQFEEKANSKVNNQRTTGEQLVNTYKNVKNVKNVKKTTVDVNVFVNCDRFYKAYPRKVKYIAVKALFKKNGWDSATVDLMCSAIERQKKSKEWLKEGGEYIPDPTSWLMDGRWIDTGLDKPKAEVNVCHRCGRPATCWFSKKHWCSSDCQRKWEAENGQA